jgi:hypothetical protein
MNRPEDVHERAQTYVDRVLDVQRRLDDAPRLTDEAYSTAVNRAAEGFASLTDKDERRDEDAVPAA